MTAGEKFFIACLVHSDIRTFSKVKKEWLDGVEVRQYRFIQSYLSKSGGELVGVKTFCDKFSLDSKEADSLPDYYFTALRDRYVFTVLADKIPPLLRGVKDAPIEKLTSLRSIISELSLDTSGEDNTLYSDDVSSRKEEYSGRVKTKGITYLSTGCPDMDSIVFGYRRQDLITIGGKSGQGKSWLLCYLAYCVEQVIQEKPDSDSYGDVLFVTNEMSSDEIKERLDCIRFRLPVESFNKGLLLPREKARYFRGLDSLKKNPSKIRIVDYCMTIDDLTTLIGVYQPSIVFLDGSYLMEPRLSETWEKIVYLTRNLKRCAKQFKIPIVNTTQLRRGSAKGASKLSSDGQDDFAYSSSYTQDSDIAYRMYSDPDMVFRDLIGLEIVKGRRTVPGTKLMFQNDLLHMSLSITIPLEESEPSKEIIDF